jgi:hypothetical protein
MLRLYYSDTFVDSIGKVIVGGAIDSSNFYKSVTCTLNTSTNVVSCPSFILASTLDSLKPTATVSGVFYGGKNANTLAKRSVLFTDWRVPASPASRTYGELALYNLAKRPALPDTYYTAAQVDAKVVLSVPPLDDDLAAIADLAPSNNDVVQRIGGVWTNRTPAQLLTNPTFAGLSRFGSGTNFDEPAQYALGSTANLFQAAEGTHSVSVGPPASNLFNPAVSVQVNRKNASGILMQLGYYQTAVENENTDFYGLYQYGQFSADLTGVSGKLFNNHGLRSYLSIDPANPGDNVVIGYSAWIQAVKSVSLARVVGLQLEANNNSGTDDFTNLQFGVRSSAALVFNSAGTNHSSTFMFSEGNTPAGAAYTGWHIAPDSVARHIIDAPRATFHLPGTITATNGSATITGSGTKFIDELVMGDQILLNGTWYTVVSHPVSDTSATLKSVFGGTTGTYTNVTKNVVPLRMAAASYITSTDWISGLVDYRLIGLNPAGYVDLDPDGRGVVIGGSATLKQPNIVGVTNGSTAAAGSVGEILSSQLPFGSAISLTSNTDTNLTSRSLTAGEWEVWLWVDFIPATSTVVNSMQASISPFSATVVSTEFQLSTIVYPGGSVLGLTDNVRLIGPARISLAETTTIYGVVRATFSASTMTAFGTIRARRIR